MKLQELQRRTKDWAIGFNKDFIEFHPITPYQGKGKVIWVEPYHIYERVNHHQKYKAGARGEWIFMLTEEHTASNLKE